ncbi:MAG: peptidoglycan-binding domain-containing protein [Chloracidobacterium sp.]|uniref:Peptidoglycan-binding protein n=1 Tax=Chloracidobacterium validum TaxID=2821543 RepID=A0ABX8BDA1_9BACT|nr:peptidoglycan-binding domain-containing protein [Chloracidobacterium validum]QUW03075.1 peptidoglycan-binding protein [Chloracidobacterium validum]
MSNKRTLLALVVALMLVSFGGPTFTFAQDAPAAETGAAPKKKKPRTNNPNTDYGKAQTTLKEAGLYQGEVTGYKNAETTEAIRKYQEQNGLKVTGTLNNETREKMGLPKRKAPAKKKKEEGGEAAPQS